MRRLKQSNKDSYQEASHSLWMPPSLEFTVNELDALIVESEKAGREFLRRFTFTGDKNISRYSSPHLK